MAAKFNACTATVKAAENQELHDICARHLYEMAADVIMSYLLLQNATRDEALFGRSAQVYIHLVEAEVEKHNLWISRMNTTLIENYRQA